MTGKLRKARNDLGFSIDEVALEAGWTKHRLEQLEASDDPDVSEALTLTDLYGVDVDALLDDEGSPSIPVSALLRAQQADISARARFAITAAASVARDARRLRDALGHEDTWAKLESFQHRPESDDPGEAEALAEHVRSRLDLGDKVIGSVSALAADLGVLVLWAELDRDVDAISMANEELGGLIVANTAGQHMGSGCQRRITLAHELCHVLFDRPRMANLDRFCVTGSVDENHEHRDNIERRARAFPAYFLAPRAAVARIWSAGGPPAEKVADVMRTFGLGYDATRHHLHFLGMLGRHEPIGTVSADLSPWDEAEAIPDPWRNTVQKVALEAGIDELRARALIPLLVQDGAPSDAMARDLLRANPAQWDAIRRAAFGASLRTWGLPSSAVSHGPARH